VNELGSRLEFGIALNLLLQKVLHGLDIVIGDRLDGLDPLGLNRTEARCDRLQPLASRGRERLEFRHAQIGQRDQPLDLDPNPVSHESGLGEQGAQRGHAAGIAPIQGRKRVERRIGWGLRNWSRGGGIHGRG